MDNCIFCKVINGSLPSAKAYEDEFIIAINDIHPQKPIHILVIPKQHIEDFMNLSDEIMLQIKSALLKLIKEKELMGKGYRVEVNGGGAQLVNHVHFHIMGPMGKPFQV